MKKKNQIRQRRKINQSRYVREQMKRPHVRNVTHVEAIIAVLIRMFTIVPSSLHLSPHLNLNQNQNLNQRDSLTGRSYENPSELINTKS